MNAAIDDVVAQFDATLDVDSRKAIARARTLAQEYVAPRARDWEYQRKLPRAALLEGCRAGLSGIEVSREAGGLGLGFGARLRIAEELAAHDLGYSFALINHQNVAVRLAGAQSDELRSWVAPLLAGDLIGCTALTEPGAGSDFAAIQTVARRVPGGWRLTGEKAWITNGALADVFMTYAQTEPGSGARGIGCFMIRADLADPDAFERLHPFELHGGHAIGAGGYRLTDCFVPDAQMLYAPGPGFRTAMTLINGARAYVAAMNAGMVDRSLRLALAYGEQRQTFGVPLLDHQGVRWKLVDVATDLEAMRLLAYRAARQIDAGHDAQRCAAIAKKFANEHALDAIAACMQAMGANGLRADFPLARHLAAARLLCYTDGTVEMMNERLAHMLRAGRNA